MPAENEDLERLRMELEAAKQQLIEAHQAVAIGRLLSGIIHEINTPIGSIFSNNEVFLRALEKLRADLDQPYPQNVERVRQIVDTCLRLASVDKIACERIAAVIRGLKTFSRVDGTEVRKVNLNESLRDTLKLTEPEFRRRITVEADFGDLPEVECFPQMLNQVFLNLLVNAAHAIEGEGRITVRTRLEGEMVHIAISDTGHGMSPSDAARAFDAGFTTKPVGVGTGLGLSIAREIVEDKHGGTITFESEPGAGTTFHICIPVNQGRGAQSREQQSS
jgi:two-component system NtrC family sensor kinase